jgi:hypothetical protein
MMAGHRFVVHERAQRVLRHPLRPQRNLKRARPRSVGRGRAVAGGGIRLAEARIRLRDDGGLRPHVELQRGALLGVAQDLLRVGHDLFPAVLRQRVALALLNRLDALGEGPLRPSQPAQDAVHFLLDRGDPLEPDLVNLVRGEIRRRKPPQREGVRFVPSLETPQARIISRAADERLEQRNGFLPRRKHLRATMPSACARSFAPGVGIDFAAAILSANAVTKGFFPGGVAMNCRICAIVARRMNRGGNRFFAIRPRAPPSLRPCASQPVPAALHVVDRVLLGDQRVGDRQDIRQVDADAAELIDRKRVVAIFLTLNERVQLPLQHVRRDALGIAHPRAVVGGEPARPF